MRLKLPDGFGGIAVAGKAVKLKADEDGCVDVEHEVGAELLSHGAKPAPAKVAKPEEKGELAKDDGKK